MLKTGHDFSTDQITRAYAELQGMHGLGPEFVRRVLDFAGDLAGARILDVGCGTGELVKAAAERSRTPALGVDFSVERLAAAGTAANVTFQAADLSGRLPLDDAAFDVVFLTEVVEHLKDPVSSLKEVRRVLRPGGCLIATVPNGTGYAPFLHLAWAIPGRWLRSKLLPYEFPGNTGQPIDTCFEFDDIPPLFEAAGFAIERMNGWRMFRYLLAVPLVRTAYTPIHPAVDALFNRVGLQRYAYNLFLECRGRA